MAIDNSEEWGARDSGVASVVYLCVPHDQYAAAGLVNGPTGDGLSSVVMF